MIAVVALGGGTPVVVSPNKSEQLFFHFGASQFMFRAGRDKLGSVRIARNYALEYTLDESE
jgi:hypothetical protein